MCCAEFLNKDLSPLSRVQMIWYATIFVRYWHTWIELHPQYTIQDNFLTQNAYTCIEINAHALVLLLVSLRDNFENSECYFCPWLLGSQTCEQAFRAARSMSSTFSSIINFGVLGLLHRLHRLQIQAELQSENEVKHPSMERHKSKHGMQKHQEYPLKDISDSDIIQAIERGHKQALETLKILGMSDLLKQHKCWDSVPKPGKTCESDDEKEDDEDSNKHVSKQAQQSVIQEVCSDDPKDIESDIKTMAGCVIDNDVKEILLLQQKLMLKRSPQSESSIAMFEVCEDSELPSKGKLQYKMHPSKSKFSPYLEVKANGRSFYIRKTTTVWLLQEGERVSADRLFRVRCKQPFSSGGLKLITDNLPSSKQGIPVIADNVQIGQLCAFAIEDGWKIGKVLQFSKYKERTKNAQKYKGTGTEISDSSIGVLCSWYVPSKESPLHFQLNQQESGFSYFPLSSYLCTLEEGGLTIFTDASVSSTIPSSILSKNTNSTVCQAKEFAIDDNTKAVIQNQLKVHRVKVSKLVSNEQKTIRTIAANVKKNAVK